eukprot:766696-Hanusia_phi.AAC.7
MQQLEVLGQLRTSSGVFLLPARRSATRMVSPWRRKKRGGRSGERGGAYRCGEGGKGRPERSCQRRRRQGQRDLVRQQETRSRPPRSERPDPRTWKQQLLPVEGERLDEQQDEIFLFGPFLPQTQTLLLLLLHALLLHTLFLLQLAHFSGPAVFARP